MLEIESVNVRPPVRFPGVAPVARSRWWISISDIDTTNRPVRRFCAWACGGDGVRL